MRKKFRQSYWRQTTEVCAKPGGLVCARAGPFKKMAGVLGKFRGFWGWYQGSLARHPVRTQVVTSGILWAVGDVMAQSIEMKIQRNRREKPPALPHVGADPFPEGQERRTANQTLDLRRVMTTSLFGFGFVGPVGHFWYETLEYIVKSRMKLAANSLPFIATKVFVDTGLFGPIHLLTFFTYAGLASGKPFEEVKKDLKRDFLPTFMTEGVTWFFVQIGNFRFVPVQHQLLFVNFFCILDSAFLSWVKHQEDAPWKRYLTALISAPNTVTPPEESPLLSKNAKGEVKVILSPNDAKQ